MQKKFNPDSIKVPRNPSSVNLKESGATPITNQIACYLFNIQYIIMVFFVGKSQLLEKTTELLFTISTTPTTEIHKLLIFSFYIAVVEQQLNATTELLFGSGVYSTPETTTENLIIKQLTVINRKSFFIAPSCYFYQFSINVILSKNSRKAISYIVLKSNFVY